jgi:hypothetical protein
VRRFSGALVTRRRRGLLARPLAPYISATAPAEVRSSGRCRTGTGRSDVARAATGRSSVVRSSRSNQLWPAVKESKVNVQRSGAAGLLGAAMLGIVAAPVVSRRYGRRGGLGVLTGVGVLLVRDTTMALTGTPARLKTLPRALLYMELGSAATATCLGLAAWLHPAGRARAQSESLRSANSVLKTAASSTAALTFLVHTSRQAIYLSPGQGRREGVADPIAAPTAGA